MDVRNGIFHILLGLLFGGVVGGGDGPGGSGAQASAEVLSGERVAARGLPDPTGHAPRARQLLTRPPKGHHAGAN